MQQRPELPAFRKSFAGEMSMLQRVLVAQRRTGAGCAAMHATTPLSLYGRGSTRSTRSSLGSAAGAKKHRCRIRQLSGFHVTSLLGVRPVLLWVPHCHFVDGIRLERNLRCFEPLPDQQKRDLPFCFGFPR
jgi:hypothetical protein